MGYNNYKKTVECDCGCDYGSNCGKKTTFLLRYNRSCDIGTLYIDGVYVLGMTDNQISALIDVLSGKGEEATTEEERKLI